MLSHSPRFMYAITPYWSVSTLYRLQLRILFFISFIQYTSTHSPFRCRPQFVAYTHSYVSIQVFWHSSLNRFFYILGVNNLANEWIDSKLLWLPTLPNGLALFSCWHFGCCCCCYSNNQFFFTNILTLNCIQYELFSFTLRWAHFGGLLLLLLMLSSRCFIQCQTLMHIHECNNSYWWPTIKFVEQIVNLQTTHAHPRI